MKPSFRQQTVVRAFAFGCAVSLAGCAADGSIKTSTQSQLVTACDKAETAITLAGFFEQKMTPIEAKILDTARSTDASFCSPSALAADLTPSAYSANVKALSNVVADMNGLTSAHTQ